MAIDVLIIDDSATIRAVIKKALALSLSDLGTVYEAADGFAGLALLADHKMHLVLVDINMPRMNGVQLVERMKQDPNLAHLPVIVISTEGSKELLDSLKEKGIAGYLRKPFRPEQLRELISPILELSDGINREESVSYDF